MKERDVSAPALPPAPPTAADPLAAFAFKAPLTRTERCFMGLLRDEKPHSVKELTTHLWDELGVNLRQVVQVWMARLRPKLPDGHRVGAILVNGSTYYQLMHDRDLPK